MADTDKSLNNLRYNQVTQGMEGFGGGTPQWTPLILTAEATNPAGNDMAIQFNNSGSFAGSDDFQWDYPDNVLILRNAASSTAILLRSDTHTGIEFDDTTGTTNATLTGNTGGQFNIAALGSISINDDFTVPTGDPSALVDIISTSKGFLPPRMTSTERDAITSPAEGLQIWNTTTHLPNWFDGTIWQTVTLTPA